MKTAKRTYRGKLPKPTARGDVRPEIGNKRFTVGNVRDTTESEMQRRLQLLRDIFEKQCDHHAIDHWAGWLVPYAKMVASGEPVRYETSEFSKSDAGSASEDALMLDKMRQIGVPFVVNDEATIHIGEKFLKQVIDKQVKDAVDKVLDGSIRSWRTSEELQNRIAGDLKDPRLQEQRTFHEAVKFYRKRLKANGKKQDNGKASPSVQNYLRIASRLATITDDFPMHELNQEKLEDLVAHWRNRPVSESTGQRISCDHAKHTIDGLWSILTMIDESADWKWDFPKGASRMNRTPIRLDSDRSKTRTRRISSSIYTPEQLAVIAESLDDFGKLILGLSVNCAMQPAEVGRLTVLDFYETHPESERVANWVIFDRPKTHNYGEWILWDEVAALAEWGIHRAKSVAEQNAVDSQDDGQMIIVNEEGVPWYRSDWTNPSTKFANWWQAKATKSSRREGIVSALARRDKNFPRHTVKSLRKILPNMIRPIHGKEIADLVNARAIDAGGRHGGRDTDRYADRLYEKAVDAVLELRSEFEPFLKALTITNSIHDHSTRTINP